MRNHGPILLCVLGLAGCCACASALILRVPVDYGTIREAVDAAAPSDTVEIAGGTYYENDIAVARALTLRAAPAAWGCVTVDAGGNGRHFSITSLPFSIGGVRLVGGRISSGNGGSVWASGSGSMQVTDCAFESNYASSSGGAFYVAGGASLRVTDSSFVGNSVGTGVDASSGGAIYGRDGSLDVSGCTFSSNLARLGTEGGSRGGAVACLYSAARFTDCIFEDNSTEMVAYYSGVGGAVYLLGTSGSAVFSDCSFLRNTANLGGAVAVARASFTSCVFVSNAVANRGAAVHSTASPSLSNCTLVSNSGIGIVYSAGHLTLDHTIIAWSIGGGAVAGNSTATASCCCLFSNNGGSWVGPLEGQGSQAGNLSSNPRFCDINGGDLTLDSSSPCAPPGPAGCGLIGALPVGCGASGVQPISWGRIKSLCR